MFFFQECLLLLRIRGIQLRYTILEDRSAGKGKVARGTRKAKENFTFRVENMGRPTSKRFVRRGSNCTFWHSKGGSRKRGASVGGGFRMNSLDFEKWGAATDLLLLP